MQILAACELSPAALERLRDLGAEVVHAPTATPELLRTALRSAAILIVDQTRVGGSLIGEAKALQMIVHAGDGPGNISLDEASQLGVFVTHCPDKTAIAVAELAFGLVLALDRDICDAAAALRDGRWNRARHAAARGLAGRSLGIFGHGPVADALVRRGLAFEMRIFRWSSRMTFEGATDATICNYPHELARQSEVLIIAGADDPENPTPLDMNFFDSLAKGTLVVHVGGSAAVDEDALADAIVSRKLRVGIDTLASVPTVDGARFRSPLLELPGVIGTPNIGSLTAQAREATAAEVARIVRAFLISGEVLNCLNLAERSPAKWQLVMRVRDQVGVMASILEAIRADGINAEEIASRVFTGAKAAWCTIALNERPSAEALGVLRAMPDVLHLELRAVV